MDFPWSELQISETTEVRTIRQAYARRLKNVHPEDDPEGFQRLREAYELALLLTSFNSLPDETAQAVPAPNASVKTPAARAAELVASVFESFSNFQEAGAVQTLQSILRSDELQSVELQLQFEQAFAEDLLHQEPTNFSLLDAVSAELKWDSTAQSGFAVQHLLERLEGWRGYRNLLRLRDSRQGVTTLRALAARMLTSPFDPRKFQMRRIRHFGLTEVVQSELNRLHRYSPATVDEFLDVQTVVWWANRKPQAFQTVALLGVALVLLIFFVVNNQLWGLTAFVFGILFLLGLVAGIFGIWQNRRQLDFPIRQAAVLLVPVVVLIVIVLALAEGTRLVRIAVSVGASLTVFRIAAFLMKKKT